MPTVSVIIPACNEAATVGEVVERVRQSLDKSSITHEIIVIDDGSTDGTAAEAKRHAARVLSHPYRMGNGAAIKSGIRRAGGEILVMLDADGQHPPELIPALLAPIDTHDMVVGARSRSSHASLGRRVANGIYNLLASYVCDRSIADLTSGFRAVRAEVARELLPILPNTFSYPTTLTLGVVRSGYSLAYLPFDAAQRPARSRSKIRLFQDGSRFLMIIFRIATLFSPLKVFAPIGIAMFLVGAGYGLFKVIFLDGSYGPTSALLMTVSAVVFLLGLVSEQIAQQRFELALSARHRRITEPRDPDPG